MRNKNALRYSIIPFVITLCLYVVFSSRIDCKPNHAGFWLIFVMGAAAAVAINSLLKKN
jgi:hypothetical protein